MSVCFSVPDASIAGRLADAIAITGYTIFINIAVTGEGNQVWNILHGPLSIVFGMFAGLAATLICAPTKLWNNVYKRTSVVFILCAPRASISGAWRPFCPRLHMPELRAVCICMQQLGEDASCCVAIGENPRLAIVGSLVTTDLLVSSGLWDSVKHSAFCGHWPMVNLTLNGAFVCLQHW